MTTLDLCSCKRGFFTLRDCGNPATTSCELCTRRMCDEHMAARIGARVCVECAAKQEEGQDPAATAQAAGIGGQPVQPVSPGQPQPGVQPGFDDEAEMREYPYRYRRQYYSGFGYYPWWWGTSDPYYNDYGYRYFDDDDDDGGGFADS